MVSQRSFGAADIARQNAEVLSTAALLLSGLLMLAVAGFVFVATAIGPHTHVFTAADWVHHLRGLYAAGIVPHVIVAITMTFVGVTLESLVLYRDAFARGEPKIVTAVLAATRQLRLGARRVATIAFPRPPLLPARLLCRDVEHGILHQLRRALSLSPLAPPRPLTLSSDPLGPFSMSGHRVEAGVAA